MGDMTIDIFKDTKCGKAALLKFGNNDSNFRIYEMERVGVNHRWMKVTGGLFRLSKKGVNKGKLSILLKDTIETVFVEL